MGRSKDNRLSWECPQSLISDVRYHASKQGLTPATWIRNLIEKELRKQS